MVEDREFEQLLELVQQGDREAIGRVYLKYLPHMERVTRYRLRKLGLDIVTTSADVHDSVFRQLLKPGAFDRITTDKHLRNFLLKACGNKVLDILAKLTSHEQDPRGMAPYHAVEHGVEAEPHDPLEHAEELDRVYSQLSPRERLLCTLRRGGCCWNEIAERLGTTPSSARKAFSRSYRRAVQLLRDAR